MVDRRVSSTLAAVLAAVLASLFASTTARGADAGPAAGPVPDVAPTPDAPAPGVDLGGNAAPVAGDAAPEAVEPSAGDSGEASPTPASPPEPETNPHRRAAAASDTVLVGTFAGVADAAGPAVSRSFTVESALLGYAGFGAPVTVRFPARGGVTPPGPGRSLLFLAGGRTDGSFVALKAVPLTDPATEEQAKRLTVEALGPRSARLTTIQATLAEWQGAWNARDIGRCILCYGRESRLRRRYAAGGSARRALRRQLSASPGTVSVAIEAIRLVLAPTSEGVSETAEVDVALTLTVRAGEERLEHGTMTFVRENGEWLVLAEGF